MAEFNDGKDITNSKDGKGAIQTDNENEPLLSSVASDSLLSEGEKNGEKDPTPHNDIEDDVDSKTAKDIDSQSKTGTDPLQSDPLQPHDENSPLLPNGKKEISLPDGGTYLSPSSKDPFQSDKDHSKSNITIGSSPSKDGKDISPFLDGGKESSHTNGRKKHLHSGEKKQSHSVKDHFKSKDPPQYIPLNDLRPLHLNEENDSAQSKDEKDLSASNAEKDHSSSFGEKYPPPINDAKCNGGKDPPQPTDVKEHLKANGEKDHPQPPGGKTPLRSEATLNHMESSGEKDHFQSKGEKDPPQSTGAQKILRFEVTKIPNESLEKTDSTSSDGGRDHSSSQGKDHTHSNGGKSPIGGHFRFMKDFHQSSPNNTITRIHRYRSHYNAYHSLPSHSIRVRQGRIFTVVPVNNETHLREQAAARGNDDGKHSLRVPLNTFDAINAEGEPTDTLTQTSITSLLSAKFRDVAKRWKQYGVESPRFRKRLHSKWESMNYDQVDSQLQRKQQEQETSKKKLALLWLSHWLIYFMIGIGTSFLAAGVHIAVELVAHQKFELIKDFLDKCDKDDCLIQPVMIWISINAGITLMASALVTYVQPMAAGSGIPLIKSYLNGVRVPGLLSLRAFIAKCVGVVLSILGGLACGKEGPMAHSGGIMGAGLGKGRIPWFGNDINLYGMFRNDHNIRDLVAAGAASGVSAAFGAPVGGTLFSVEEAASFWNTELVWKVFFSAMIACFSTNVWLSAFEGHPTQLSNPGLVRFNTFPNLTFDLIEIPVFIVMAAIGGLTGSLFVVMNYKLTVFRQKYLHRKKWIKVIEAALVAVVSAIVAFILMFAVKDCTDAHPRSHHAILTKLGCSGESHNSMSTMFLTTPEGCLKSLLHDPLETYSVLSLVLFIVIFFLLGVWTYGLSVSSGVFIPSLAIGAAWGRLIGLGVVQLFPDQAKDVGKYALIGAASQLGGILRTTISLTVIIVECTGDITFGLCIMIALMISKWVGDFFTTGLYDMNVEVSGIPLLSWEPPPLCDHVSVSDLMSQPVMTLLPVEKVGHIVDCLKGETFHGFPVIEQDPNYDLMYKGKLKGIILRHQILVLLKNKVFCPEGQIPTTSVTLKDFDTPYPIATRLKIEDIELSDADKECVIDLQPYMHQTPYVVPPNFSMPRVFRLFRGLGLRHLVVVNDNFEPVGMVTRKDLAKYRAQIKKGMLHMEQLTVENR